MKSQTQWHFPQSAVITSIVACIWQTIVAEWASCKLHKSVDHYYLSHRTGEEVSSGLFRTLERDSLSSSLHLSLGILHQIKHITSSSAERHFKAGCRRFTSGGHYLNALQQPNTLYLKDSVFRLTNDGLVTKSGKRNYLRYHCLCHWFRTMQAQVLCHWLE